MGLRHILCLPWAAQGADIAATAIASKCKLQPGRGEKRLNSHLFLKKGEITVLPALSSTFQLPLPWLQPSNNRRQLYWLAR